MTRPHEAGIELQRLGGPDPNLRRPTQMAIRECEWKRDLVDETKRGPERVLDRRGLLMEVIVFIRPFAADASA